MRVWDRVIVADYGLDTGAYIQWFLDLTFPGPDPWLFSVMWSHTQAGPWEEIGTTANNFYFDTSHKNYGKYTDSYYKVVLYDGNGELYESAVVSIFGILNRHDYLLVREMIRREYLLLQRYTGKRGWLFKRYSIGTPCSRCLDYDLEQVKSSKCYVCNGTGLVGGYSQPIETYIAVSGDQKFPQFMDNINQVDPSEIQGRTVAYPDINVGDFWVEADTNLRYTINKVQNAATLRGVPLISNVVLRAAPSTDPIYELPVSWDGGLSSSSSSSSD